MIVRNEELFLDEALRSVRGVVDEICIVDTGSSDRTIEIARSHGAKIREIDWRDDFSAARNAALGMATRRWIVVLDADEWLDPDSAAALAAIGQTPAAGRGKWITCCNLIDSHEGSGAMTNALVRVFPNDPRIRYRNMIHEFIALDGSESGLPSDKTSIAIVHRGYLSGVIAERRKGERNLRLSRLAIEREPNDPFHHYNLGMACLLDGDRDGAIVALDRTRELTHGQLRAYRPNTLIVLAELYDQLRGDSQTALALVGECLTLLPNYSSAHFTQGNILSRAGRLHEARDAFGRAIAAGAHDRDQFVVDNEIAIWKAHSEIGATLMREDRFAEALNWFELAAAARPAALTLVVNRARCRDALGDVGAAAMLFERAFADAGDEASAVEWINCLFRAGRNAQAFAAIEQVLPRVDASVQVTLLGSAAATHLRAGDRARAQVAIDRAVERGTSRSDASALIEALAAHLAMPELAELLPVSTIPRANHLRIAYVTST